MCLCCVEEGWGLHLQRMRGSDGVFDFDGGGVVSGVCHGVVFAKKRGI